MSIWTVISSIEVEVRLAQNLLGTSKAKIAAVPSHCWKLACGITRGAPHFDELSMVTACF
eukprot:93785-Pelagomonas_calceolata.AAC.1